jgi:hypothetical protein
MHGLSAAGLLDVWEEGAARAPARRALALVAAAGGVREQEALSFPVARRDAALLELRRLQLGDAMDATVCCPECGEVLDVALDAAAVAAPVTEDELQLTAAGYEVEFRLPATADVEAAAASDDVRGAVLGRCILAARSHGDAVAPADLPGEVLTAVEDAMEASDTASAAALTCAACGYEWAERLDVAAFVWEEIAALARRVTADVHVLASAYGWSEADILGLRPARRRLYVEVVNA